MAELVSTPPADAWVDWVESSASSPSACAGGRARTSPGRGAGEGEGQFHAPGAVAVRDHAYAGREDNELVLWLRSVGALVAGDSLSDFGDGLAIQLGGRTHVTRDEVAARLRPLLDLPVELVLTARGEPADRAALERALRSGPMSRRSLVGLCVEGSGRHDKEALEWRGT